MGIIYNPFSLEGKTILVTGASSGIGQETSISCSKISKVPSASNIFLRNFEKKFMLFKKDWVSAFYLPNIFYILLHGI